MNNFFMTITIIATNILLLPPPRFVNNNFIDHLRSETEKTLRFLLQINKNKFKNFLKQFRLLSKKREGIY